MITHLPSPLHTFLLNMNFLYKKQPEEEPVSFNHCVRALSEIKDPHSATSDPSNYYPVVKETAKAYQNVFWVKRGRGICSSWNSFSDAYICSQTPCQLTTLLHLTILFQHPSICSLSSLFLGLFSFLPHPPPPNGGTQRSFLLVENMMLLAFSPPRIDAIISEERQMPKFVRNIKV